MIERHLNSHIICSFVISGHGVSVLIDHHHVKRIDDFRQRTAVIIDLDISGSNQVHILIIDRTRQPACRKFVSRRPVAVCEIIAVVHNNWISICISRLIRKLKRHGLTVALFPESSDKTNELIWLVICHDLIELVIVPAVARVCKCLSRLAGSGGRLRSRLLLKPYTGKKWVHLIDHLINTFAVDQPVFIKGEIASELQVLAFCLFYRLLDLFCRAVGIDFFRDCFYIKILKGKDRFCFILIDLNISDFIGETLIGSIDRGLSFCSLAFL